MEEVRTKFCSKCKIEKVINEFHKNRTMKDGTACVCKLCRSISRKEITRKRNIGKTLKKEQLEQLKLDKYKKGIKECYVCGQEKSLDSFNKDKAKYDGLSYRCKLCAHKHYTSEEAKQVLKKRQEKWQNSKEAKRIVKICSVCDEEKKINAFSKSKNNKDGLMSRCKLCEKQYNQSDQAKTALKKRQEDWSNSKESKKTTKICGQCNEEKDLSEFYKDKSTKTGFSSQCKSCSQGYAQSEKCKLTRKKRQETWLNSGEGKKVSKICHTCGCDQKLDKFDKDRSKRDGLATKCKQCAKEHNQSEEGQAATARAWHKRRAHIENTENTLTAQEWSDILEEQNNACNMCGREFSDDLKSTKDHKIPVSRGGGLTRENVQALCRSCNSSKGTKTPEEVSMRQEAKGTNVEY